MKALDALPPEKLDHFELELSVLTSLVGNIASFGALGLLMNLIFQ